MKIFNVFENHYRFEMLISSNTNKPDTPALMAILNTFENNDKILISLNMFQESYERR